MLEIYNEVRGFIGDATITGPLTLLVIGNRLDHWGIDRPQPIQRRTVMTALFSL